ncbi:MAG: EAL domain-containing protein [Leptospiraceae bacterium]|nr:EAL domain-containing protein [Leptospiraceae bacterium]
MMFNLPELRHLTQNLTVLYVEDDESISQFMSSLLRRLFNTVLIEMNGIDGLRSFKENQSTIDIIISDITMPGMNGLDMIDEIKKITYDIPVIFVSAHNDQEFFLRAIELGVEFFLIKPIDISQLASVLNKVLEKINLRNEIRKIREIYTDPLTGLQTRAKFIIDLDEYQKGTLVIVNFHSFQNINNFYGHEVGDKLLQSFSIFLKEYFEDMDWKTYYFGSDEYAIYLPREEEKENLAKTIKRLLGEINSMPFIIEGVEIYLSVYAGIATVGIENTVSNQLLNHALLAQYEAKKRRLSHFNFENSLFEESISHENVFWIRKINEAILNDFILLYFQPLYDVKAGVIEKYETLMRLKTSEGKIIGPDKFLPVAKKTSLYTKLTVILFNKIFDYLENSPYTYSVNLSFLDISNRDTANYLLSMMKNNSSQCKKLIIEITEGEGILNFREVIDFMFEAKEYGVHFAIDDFGSGYSNFTYLMDLNLDYIKIDGSIISAILKNDKVQYITKMIVEYCKYCNLKTVAEYVSDVDIYNKIIELDIDFAQGYYIGKPSETLITKPDFLI